MMIIGIQSSPNTDGLTSMLVRAVLEGAETKGIKTKLIHLNLLNIRTCKAHNLDGRGWGTCRTKGICMIKDDF